MAAKTAASLFDADQVVATPRLRLSPLLSDSIDAMASWLEAALAPDWRLEDLTDWVEADAAALISDASGAPLGAAVAVLDRPYGRSASVPFVSIEPARRFRGLGGAAALALERHLRLRFGVEKVYAPVPDGRGLAVYFWLRLGYRPLIAAEAPGGLVGLTSELRPGIWLVRERG